MQVLQNAVRAFFIVSVSIVEQILNWRIEAAFNADFTFKQYDGIKVCGESLLEITKTTFSLLYSRGAIDCFFLVFLNAIMVEWKIDWGQVNVYKF